MAKKIDASLISESQIANFNAKCRHQEDGCTVWVGAQIKSDHARSTKNHGHMVCRAAELLRERLVKQA